MPLFHSEVYATANERLWKMGNLRRKMTLTSGGFFTLGPVISSPWWQAGGTRYLHADWTRNSGASRRGWQFDSWLRILEPWELLSSEAVSASGKCLKSFKGRLFFPFIMATTKKTINLVWTGNLLWLGNYFYDLVFTVCGFTLAQIIRWKWQETREFRLCKLCLNDMQMFVFKTAREERFQ